MGRKKQAQVDAEPAGDVAEYAVLSPLNHDGDRYEIGETIELDPAQAAPLLQANVVKAPTTTDPSKEGSESPGA